MAATDELARFRLDARVAVVSGGTGAIGRRLSLALARAGANVAIIGRSAADAQDAARDVQDAGAQALLVSADVTKKEDADHAIDQTTSSSTPSAVAPGPPSTRPTNTRRANSTASSI
jgi:NAD(P)-dependent dehydrogenase (short-subunit alcohol dehydrogenase family)